jgi:hypothetical protein
MMDCIDPTKPLDLFGAEGKFSRSPNHWITSSALSNTDCGIVRPSALAVFRLITSSNLLGCMTGRSVESVLDGDVLALDIAGFAQSSAERSGMSRRFFW